MSLSPEARHQLDLFRKRNGHFIGYHSEGCQPFILGGAMRLDQRELLSDRPLFLHYALDGHWEAGRNYEIIFDVADSAVWYTNDQTVWNALTTMTGEPGRGMSPTKKLDALMRKGYRLFLFRCKDESDEAILFPAPDSVREIKFLSRGPLSQKYLVNEINLLTEIIGEAQIAYHDKNKPTMSDAQYDQFVKSAREYLTDETIDEKQKEALKNVVERVGIKPARRGLYPVKHRTPMLSLDNAFTVEELQIIFDTWGGAEIDTSFKYDGLAVGLTYYDHRLVEAATRGDRYEGESILHNVLNMDSIPKFLPDHASSDVEIRGELVMFDDEFSAYNERLKAAGRPLSINPRNAAAGIARRLRSDKVPGAKLVFIPYSVHFISDTSLWLSSQMLAALHTWGFDLTWAWLAPSFRYHSDRPEELRTYLDDRLRQRVDLPFGVDGLVFRVNDLEVCEKLGYTSRAPRWAIAYKFPAEEKTTTVRNIRLQIGRTGNATPVAEVDPVVVGGVTVTNATLHNEDQIERLGLAIGDKVIIRRAGDVVPEIASVSYRPKNRVKWSFPTLCDCGGTLVRAPDQANHICDNDECHHRIQRAFEHFVSRNAMDIEGLGEELLEKLLTAGKIRWLPDLYKLTTQDILDVTSETSTRYAEVVVGAVHRSRKTTVRRFINALGIPMAGEGTAKRLHEFFGTFRIIQQASPALLKAVPDIGPTVAENIAEYFENALWINELLSSKTVEFTDEMGPCPEFAKYEDLSELLLLSGIKGVTRKKLPDILATLDRVGYPGHKAVIGLVNDPQFQKDQAFFLEHHRALHQVENDWNLVKRYLDKVRKIDNNQPLTGSTYVITGTFDDTLGSRDQLTKALEGLGAKVSGSVSAKTTAVFVGDSPGASKLDKAQALNVPTLFVNDLRGLLAHHSQ